MILYRKVTVMAFFWISFSIISKIRNRCDMTSDVVAYFKSRRY